MRYAAEQPLVLGRHLRQWDVHRQRLDRQREPAWQQPVRRVEAGILGRTDQQKGTRRIGIDQRASRGGPSRRIVVIEWDDEPWIVRAEFAEVPVPPAQWPEHHHRHIRPLMLHRLQIRHRQHHIVASGEQDGVLRHRGEDVFGVRARQMILVLINARVLGRDRRRDEGEPSEPHGHASPPTPPRGHIRASPDTIATRANDCSGAATTCASTKNRCRTHA